MISNGSRCSIGSRSTAVAPLLGWVRVCPPCPRPPAPTACTTALARGCHPNAPAKCRYATFLLKLACYDAQHAHVVYRGKHHRAYHYHVVKVGPQEDNAGDIITEGFLMAEELNMHFSVHESNY